MSYLDKLFEGIEVEWKPLGEIGKFSYGYAAKAQDSGNARFVRISDINDDGKLKSNKAKYVNISDDNTKYILVKNDLLMARTGATYGKTMIFEEDYSAIYAGFLIKLNLDSNVVIPKYYWHFAQSKLFWDQANKLVSGGGQPQFNGNALKHVKISIPPLKIQKEIVRILDAFTELTAELTAELITELTAELTARKQEYSYYLEQFFRFEKSEVERESLSKIGEFQRGKRFVKNDLISEGVPTIHYGEMYTHYGTWAEETKSFVSEELVKNKNLRIAEKGDVVIVAAGETIEDIGKGTAWLGDEGVVIHDACFSFRSPLNPKYVAYFTRTRQFHDQIRKHISSGKISAIHSKGLSKVVIPVPSKEAQERIVSILDKFDVLTNSISEGLPKEIELRHQQYEYYRNLLLTFPKDNIDD